MSEVYFDYGHAVRVIRNIRNDGTYPGEKTGNLLVRRGSVGFVRSRGTFLQDQVIYEVHFMDEGKLIGCREEELIDADDEWIPSRFEFSEQVKATKRLSANGEILAEIGDVGQIIKVLRQHEGGVAYHVRFPGRTLLVPETSIAAVESAEETAESVE